MRRLAVVLLLLAVEGTVLSAQQLSLPFASPPYGKNGNYAFALELTPTLTALKSGALGVSMSAEIAPQHTSKYSVKGVFSYFRMDSTSLFASSMFLSGLSGTITTNILDFRLLMRAYPTAQSINTFFVGMGFGANVLLTTTTAPSNSIFANLSSNTVVQPEIEFETGYKFRLLPHFFVEPSLSYLLMLPPPGVTFSASIPIYTFLTTSSSGLLTGIQLAVSAGFEY